MVWDMVMVYKIWFMEYDSWDPACGVWYIEPGIWDKVIGIWYMWYDICDVV